MKILTFVLLTLAATFLVFSWHQAISAPDAVAALQELPVSRDVFSGNDHLLIVRALAGGVRTGTILIAAKPGALTRCAIACAVLATMGRVVRSLLRRQLYVSSVGEHRG